MATFVPEAWVGDNAVEVDGRVQFDVTEQIEQMGRKKSLSLRDNQYETDDLVPAEILEKHGQHPFHVKVEEAIKEHFGVTA